jgi:O-antigen/teichoic acid export membrane protein
VSASSVTGPVQRVLTTAAGQLVGKLLHLIVNVLSTLLIIRYLSPSAYGRYTFALSTTMLLGLVADGGLAKLAIREVAQGSLSQDDAAGALLTLRISLAGCAALFTQFLLSILRAPQSVHVGAATLSAVYLFEAIFVVFSLPFHLNQRQGLDTQLRLAGEVVETSLLIVLIAIQAPLVSLFAAPVVGAIVGAGIAGVIGLKRYHLRPTYDRVVIRNLWREAAPLIPTVVVGVAAIRLGGFLVARMSTQRSLGLYNAALQPIEYAFLATAVVVHIAFPRLAGVWGCDRTQFQTIHRHTTQVLLTATLLVPLSAMFLATPLVGLAYGDQYKESARLLMILSWSLPLMTISAWNSFVLLASGRQISTLLYDIGALIVALILQPLFIWRWGLIGAASATIVVVSLVAAVSSLCIQKQLAVRTIGATAIPLLIAVIFAIGGFALFTYYKSPLSWLAILSVPLFAFTGHRTQFFPIVKWAQSLAQADRHLAVGQP